MSVWRRMIGWWAAALAVAAFLAGSPALTAATETRVAAGGDTQPIANRDAAIARGVEWLLARQQPDGSWRSEAYAQLGDGPAATALVAATLARLSSRATDTSATSAADSTQQAVQRSLKYLVRSLALDGEQRAASNEYPTYAAALTLLAIERLPAAEREPYADTANRLRKRLVAAQVTAPQFNKIAVNEDVGGWGLVGGDPADASSFRTANISTTRYVLSALRSVAGDHPQTFKRARQFLHYRQNADGGFTFLSDPVDQLNKAGAVEGKTPDAPLIARSYGTATADGLLALRAVGHTADSPPVVAAIGWLNERPQLDAVPGFPSDAVSTAMSQGLFYYYAAALAEAMAAYPEAAFARRAAELEAQLVSRQRPDGSWANTISTMREDDPLVATALALDALAALPTARTAE